MPQVDGADDFLAELLDGLDGDAVFSSPTASGSFRPTPKRANTPARTANGLTKRPKLSAPRPIPHASSPLSRELPSPAPNKAPTPHSTSRPAAQPPTPGAFWSALSPLALQRSGRRVADENGRPAAGITPTRVPRLKRKQPSSPVVKPDPDDSSAKRRVAHVEVGLEPAPRRAVLGERRLNVDRSSAATAARPSAAPASDFDLLDGDFLLDDKVWEEALGPAAGTATGSHSSNEHLPRCRQYSRCTVEEVLEESGPQGPRKLLRVSGDSFNGERTIAVEDDWIDSAIEAGDIVNYLGEKLLCDMAEAETALLSRRSRSLLVIHPDVLVSATKAADSSHCTRKAVLQEIIRTTGETTPSLVYGNMLHALMQACMLANRWDEPFRQDKAREIVKASGGQLWTLNVGFEQAEEELAERSKGFEAFADRFTGKQPKPDAFLSDSSSKESDRARLAISAAVAEEEDIWSPRTGLKGKIDVTTIARLEQAFEATEPGPVPFEIKTGRTNAGMEHRAQTMLYTLLLEDRYDQEVQTGLLMYTQSNDVFAVHRRENELRGLIMARNRFATHLHRRQTFSSTVAGDDAAPSSSRCEVRRSPSPAMSDDEAALWDSMPSSPGPAVGSHEPSSSGMPGGDDLLPEPIDESADNATGPPPNDELLQLYDKATGHLTDGEATFFKSWERLISFEEQELARFKKEIWTLLAEEREQLGRCLADMVIADEPTVEKTEDGEDASASTAGSSSIHRFTYRMRRRDCFGSETATLLGEAISVNDPVVLSLEDPPVLAISRGFVLEVSLFEVVVGVDRSLSDLPQLQRSSQATPIYRIDKDELAAGMGRIRDNLLQLFYAGSPNNERRRKLLVGLEPPRFDSAASAAAHTVMPSHLNADQVAAVERVMSARDYALILGMPGTGKTTTTAEIIRALARAGKTVLLTSYTHSAVDNILMKLVDGDGPSILRLGNVDKIQPALRRFALTPADYATSLPEIEARLMEPQVVATTCLGINEPIFAKRRFDVCIVDEASQVTLPTCLGPLRFADRFVLVGDHNQLPPLVRNKAALAGGLDVSLFKRLSDAHPDAVVNLTCQYRMNADIMSLSNELVYSGRLRAGAESVGSRSLALPRATELDEGPRWVQEILKPSRSVVFVDTDGIDAHERRDGSSIDNPTEAQLVQQLVSGLKTGGIAMDDVAVITPYRHQVKLLAHEVASCGPVEVLTADRSQGRDKECIVVSLVRSNSTNNAGDLLKDRRRINVCLTRAKAKLIIVGSRTTVSNAPVMRELLDLVSERDWVYRIPAGETNLPVPAPSRCDSTKVANQAVRRGGGALAFKNPLLGDITNSID
ncbi:DNA replication endonuclease-helicase Dna2 [Rhodotorula sphaerocarpa]